MFTILITGDFCVGKDLVADIICGYDAPINKILSYATRKPRYDRENTHEFCSKEEFLAFDDIIAQTQIGGEYYGARASQFKEDMINIYVVDNKGVVDIMESDLHHVAVVEVVRPVWLRNCPQDRQQRERTHEDQPISVDYRIVNDGDLLRLKSICEECFVYLMKMYKHTFL